MQDIIGLQQKIVPELIELLEKRYTIMRHISHHQPIGRRNLALLLNYGERGIRAEIEFLKLQGLLESDASGVKLTLEGDLMVNQLSEVVKQIKGLIELENVIGQKLCLSKVIVIPGDSDIDKLVKKEMARATARYMMELLGSKNIVAVTGGTTIGEVAEAVPVVATHSDILVVPARGGLGEDVEIQANTIAAKIAKRLNASYRLLHVPDNISEETVKSLSREAGIKELTQTIKKANILIHGIGNAWELSVSRGDSETATEELLAAGAVGEAFGHYFARNGSIAKNIHSLGIRLNDLKNIKHVIGVAGGSKKAEAILAVISNKYEKVLVTDEGAARAIIKLLK